MTVYVNDARTVLVTQYEDGTMTVATRKDSDAVWGPPVKVVRERG